MKVICKHCGAKARISHSRQVTDNQRDIYIDCQNIECGARYLATLKFQYDITPPRSKYISLLEKHLSELPPDERLKLIKRYG